MNYEVKSYKFICERCQKIEFVRDVSAWKPPDNWIPLEVKDGELHLTRYSRFSDLCPNCHKEINETLNK